MADNAHYPIDPRRLSQGTFDGDEQITLDLDGEPIGYFGPDHGPLVRALIAAYALGADPELVATLKGKCQAYQWSYDVLAEQVCKYAMAEPRQRRRWGFRR